MDESIKPNLTTWVDLKVVRTAKRRNNRAPQGWWLRDHLRGVLVNKNVLLIPS